MNSDLFVTMLRVSIIASIISSQVIQKIKGIFRLSNGFNKLLSVIISLLVGYSYSYCFYSSNIVYDIWIGIFTLIGAEGMYKSFKGSFGLESCNK